MGNTGSDINSLPCTLRLLHSAKLSRLTAHILPPEVGPLTRISSSMWPSDKLNVQKQ